MSTDYEIPEGLNIEWPDVSFDTTDEGGISLRIRPDYFDTLQRVFVLLHNDAPLGREIHNIVQAHFGTGMPTLPAKLDTGVTQADLRAVLEMEQSSSRLTYRIAVALNNGETPEPGELSVAPGWSDNQPMPDAPTRWAGYGDQYADINYTAATTATP
jgi:hypothetical protein